LFSFRFQFFLDWLLGVDFLYSNLIFACLNLVAVTVFLELWKRRSEERRERGERDKDD
jgi:hypothetical protein